MKMAHIFLLWWLPTVVTLGFIWLVTTHGLALEMAAVLLVLLMGRLQFVSVSYMHGFKLHAESHLFFFQKLSPALR